MSGSSPGSGPQYLLDGMSLAFRAYFALPPDLATESGAVTNALHGFVSMLTNIVRDHSPGALAVAFDLPGGTFRDELVEEYKAGRAETPDDLMPQFDMIREVLGALCVPVVGVPGYEADDVLATLATEARDRDCDVVVVTGDRDCFQLVEDPHVRVLYNRRGVSDYTLYDEEGIIARTGVEPRKYPMLAALRGDPSDNLPGVPGVGEKTAAKLLNTYDDIDGIYAHLDALSPKLRENLAAHEAGVRANLEVIPLVRDVVMDVTVEDLSLGGWDRGIAAATFERYELRTLWKRVTDLLDEGRLGLPRDGQLSAPETAAPEGAQTAGSAERAANASTSAPPTAEPGQDVALADIPPPLPAAAEPAVLEHYPVASEAVAALRALPGSVGDGTVVVTGWWDGTPGRSALRGLGLMGPESPPAGMWIRSHQLEQATVRKALNVTLAGTPVAGHHVKELLRSLLPIGIDCTGLVMDTAVAAYLLDPNQGDYSLASLVGEDLVAAPLVLPLEGDGGLLPNGRADPVAVGAAEAAAVHRLVTPYRGRLDAEGLGPLHDEVERPLIRVLAKMEVAGIRVDVEELRRISDELVAETKRLEAEIHRLAGHEFNVNSTPQLRTVLYDELGLTPGRKTKTGYSTDAATLESLRDDHGIIETLLGYREVEKLRSTYGESLLAEVAWDGRIHASFRQTVARTGRLSSDRPNLHNIPVRTDVGRRFRRAFVPEQGMKFLVADYDQVELRVIAHLSGDPGLIEAFTSGADVHRTVASGVYGVPADEVTKAQRDRAKMVSYGLAYGMEPFGLARRLSSSVDEANEISDRYFAAFPMVKEYMEETVSEARRRGFTRTALGRKRPLPDLDARNYRERQAAVRQAMNAGIQGLAADLFKTALVRLDRALEEGALESRLVLQIHDEVILEVRPREEDRAVELTRSMLTGAADLSVPLEVSMGLGDSWDGAKP
jgi:DNA polymerase I